MLGVSTLLFEMGICHEITRIGINGTVPTLFLILLMLKKILHKFLSNESNEDDAVEGFHKNPPAICASGLSKIV